MTWFAENKCHLCSKVFCCPDCRASHQKEVHKIEPNCEICLNGRATIKDITLEILNHIKAVHWPLHCVFCKKVFNSLDELAPHDKCTMNPYAEPTNNMPNTPITPVGEQEASLVSPFYKISVPGNLQQGPTATIGATSTPLQQNQDKITPININQNKLYKSNLKLTGSSSHSDSKKLERRVTFCETPSFSSDPYKKEKKEARAICLQSTTHESEISDDSYNKSSKENIYKTPPMYPETSDKENIYNENTIFDKTLNTTMWESALTHVEYRSATIELNDTHPNHYNNMEVQINIYNQNFQDQNEKLSESITSPKSISLWASVSKIMKSVVNNISTTAQTNFSTKTSKRPHPDNDAGRDSPNYKRMKLTELRCRPSIRSANSFDFEPLPKIQTTDKATQTDDAFYTTKK